VVYNIRQHFKETSFPALWRRRTCCRKASNFRKHMKRATRLLDAAYAFPHYLPHIVLRKDL